MAGKNINELNSVRVKRPPANYFNLTHEHKTTGNMGFLIPVMIMDCVPGDLVKARHEALIRLAPMVAPMMHRINVSFHTWAVPYRILWDGFEEYYTLNPGDGPAFPYFTLDPTALPPNPLQIKLCDYMGLPVTGLNADQTDPVNVSLLPFVAYQKCFNEMYRDQNLVPEVDTTVVDGDNSGQASLGGLLTLRRRAWEHDYFTSALPFAQKGNPVDLPIGNFNDVRVVVPQGAGSLISSQWNVTDGFGTASNLTVPVLPLGDPNLSDLWAQTSDLAATSATVNALRRAFRLQEFLELDARAGTRMTEVIWAHFGVKSSDARLQRPEYVTGSVSPIVISEVLQTSETATSPQGNMAGHGIGVTNGNTGSYFCEEPTYLITLMSVMPKPAYQQGIPRHFLKINDKYEFYWNKFANLGEQEIWENEVYAYTDADDIPPIFGYSPRYGEYRFMNSRVSGDFKTTLDFWTMGRIFSTAPQLAQDFIECDPTHRVFAVTDPEEDKLWIHVLNVVKARRPMPRFGTPSI